MDIRPPKKPVESHPKPVAVSSPDTSASPDKPKRESRGFKSILSTIGILLLAPVIALLLTSFVFQSYEVDGQSMMPTLQNNDRLIVWKFPRTVARITHGNYHPRRGEIIIFNRTGSLEAGGGDKQLVKRVIGLPGERVVVKDGSITVYNDEHPEGFNPDTSGLYTITAASTPGEVDVVVPDNEIFVSGDNRENSLDSRSFGPVPMHDIVGKLSIRILPLSEAKRF